MDQQPSPGTIIKQIALVMGEMKPIPKDQKNASQGWKFRGIDQFYNECQPIMAKHGVVTVPKVLSKRSTIRKSSKGAEIHFVELTVEYRFYTTDGSYITAVIEGEAMDSGDKAANKALAVAHKYALMQVFSVPTDELEDPDKVSHDTDWNQTPVSVSQSAEVKQSDARLALFADAKQSGLTDELVKFLRTTFGEKPSAELTVQELGAAKVALQAFKKGKQNG